MKSALTKSLFKSLAKDLLNTKQFYIDEKHSQFIPTAFDNIYITLKSQNGIGIIFLRDRGDSYCMLSFANHNFDIENIYLLLGLKEPNFESKDFFTMTRQVSKSFSENMNSIFKLFDGDNVSNTINKLNFIVEENRKLALDKIANLKNNEKDKKKQPK